MNIVVERIDILKEKLIDNIQTIAQSIKSKFRKQLKTHMEHGKGNNISVIRQPRSEGNTK